MTDQLEAPASANELYLAIGEEVSEARPLLTGDILGNIDIPGVESASDAIILQHPCSMRKDGVSLRDRILAARVVHSGDVAFSRWHTGFFGQMPLPDLYGPSDHGAAIFEDIGMVPSSSLENEMRLACLSRKGINLLQQRFVFFLTRFIVPTLKLDEVSAPVLEEVELVEEWTLAAQEMGEDRETAYLKFHEWIRGVDESGGMRQKRLADAQGLPAVRRALRQEIESRLKIRDKDLSEVIDGTGA